MDFIEILELYHIYFIFLYANFVKIWALLPIEHT